MENSMRSSLTVILNTFFMCIVVYFIEYKFFYSKTVPIFGTTIINKIFGIIAVLIALRILNSSLKSIGYIAQVKKIILGIITPIVILSICAIMSFLFIKMLVTSQGASIALNYHISVSRLESASSPTYISFIINLITALLSSIMLETLLRGLVLQTANNYLRFYAANTINVILTIIWHSVIYVFTVIFGSMSASIFIKSLLFTVIIYACAAIRKSLYTRANGTIWACLVDCLFSLMVIHNLPITITLPTDFTITNPIGYLVFFMSTKATNSSYATITFLCLVNVLAMLIMVVYCSILKKRARKKYIRNLTKNT